MSRSLSLIAMLVGFAAAPILAHEGGVHVKGTVVAITAEKITVKKTAGSDTEIKLNEKTQFVRAGAPAKRDDLKQGDRVVVHARKNDGALEASEIRFGFAGKKESH